MKPADIRLDSES